MTASAWRAERNRLALERLHRALPAVFPAPVLAHALAQPLIPPTPRRAVESYWRGHVIRADRLARALAARSGAPEGWTWRVSDDKETGLAASFRAPPAPYRESTSARGPGWCRVCGQPVYRFGWHRDLWREGRPNRRASWHSACVTAWTLWTAPSDHSRVLKRLQRHRCALTGKRLLRTSEVDHRIPLYRVWGEHRDRPWPALLSYWGIPNLQVINRAAHAEKCAAEAGARAESARTAREARPRP